MSQSNNQTHAFPTSAYHSVTGPVQVSDKHYSAEGQVIDASNDTAYDVNYGTDVTVASRGCKKDRIEIDNGSNASGSDETKQKHPNQTFLSR